MTTLKKIGVFLCMIMISISYGFSYNFSQKDTVIIQKIENTLFGIIDNKQHISAQRVMTFIKKKLNRSSKNVRVSSVLGKIYNDIDRKYFVSRYATVGSFTPILNTSDFKKNFGGIDGKSLNFDGVGEIYAVEHIAPPGTLFLLEQKMDNGILKVSTKNYPYLSTSGLFIHENFIDHRFFAKPQILEPEPLDKKTIIQRLESIVGVDYVWGGNVPEGIPKMLTLFSPKSSISQKKKEQWTLAGVDCSGLIYWASNNMTPRNTSEIVSFGEPVNIEGKKYQQIVNQLQPLDIIVWRGHMVLVLDSNNTIESAVGYSDGGKAGVRIRPLSISLKEILQQRVPVNNYNNSTLKNKFTIRRWIK